jgi:hypothetical protein
MVPGLEERLMEGSDENIGHIGELVSISETFAIVSRITMFYRYRKARPAQGLTTRKA